jgi:iron-sulfur cluster repair protein YtfE (RIC family)
MNPTTTKIEPDLSVNEIIRRYPRALRVLNSFGVDTCCGGEDTLSHAAATANVPLERVVNAISEATHEGF